VRWNVLSALNRNGKIRRSGWRKRRWVHLRMNLQLGQDVLHVHSHDLGRDPQCCGDLRTGASLDEELQHLLPIVGPALPAFPRSPKMYGSGWAAKASMGAWSGTGVGASLHRSAVSFSQHADEDAPKRPIPRAVD